MDDRKLDELLADAARTYHVPRDAPLDDIWSRVEAEAFTPAAARRAGPGRYVFGAALAASLVLGVTLGRFSARGASAGAMAAATSPAMAAASAAAPYQRAAEEFLGRTALLIASLPRDASGNPALTNLPEQATQLLNTTRLLLDSPMAKDARMKDLLQDLELVLAQVARLQPRRNTMKLNLITQTLEEREVMPRIQSAVADLAAFDY